MKQSKQSFSVTSKRLIRSTLVLASSAIIGISAWAVTPFAVRDIRLEGLQRVEPGTIFATIPFRIGDTYDDGKGSDAIRSLFALGLFKDVRIEAKDGVLIVIVEERPIIANVEFSGAKEFDKEALIKSLREIGLSDGQPFDKALADRAERALKQQYAARSMYAVEVTTTLTPIERNRVNLTFSVVEGDVAKIREIKITGNKAYSESTLRGLFDLDTGGLLSWYTKSDRYTKAKLNADIETLKSYYLSRGYLEFRVDSNQVDISADKKDVIITINVTEGERFVISGIKLTGNYLGKEAHFKSLVQIAVDQEYNADKIAQTNRAFTNYFGDFGFAFARVEVKPEIDRKNNKVALTINAEPGQRAYVRRINIAGNNKTRDEVIRREFRQFETSWYDGEKLRSSRDRVDRLGYFKDVQIETLEIPGNPDQVDILMTVVEKPTGNLSLGAGYNTSDKLSFQFGIKQENIFGSGNYLGIDVNTSKLNRTAILTTIDPYFTQDGVSRTLDAYYRTTRPTSAIDSDYSLLTIGSSLKFGLPISPTDTIYLGGGIERNKIVDGTNLPQVYKDYAEQFGSTSDSVPLTIGWSRDDRDSALTPNSGKLQRLAAEWSPAGDVKYVKAVAQYQQYIPLNKQFTLAFNGEVNWGKGLSGNPFPVFKNSYSGGLGSVRGFESSSLGAIDAVSGNPIGGPKKVTLNAEFLTPFPGAGNDKSLRLFAFFDAGNVFAESEKVSFKSLRTSVGVGINWLSPIGPLRISYAKPLRTEASDKIEKFQFSIGTAF
ncbi:MAG: outer membrane protein assembly factor BamA [Polaromonas sp.]|nr:outer membrane protein assembly factor BamA [Polaromonas sp.]MBP6087972.1 outer membrane protein assembly factor BamA [Polaromonas sp.]MBP6155625.1 outer membrane protein assembly factor BamA [Polaromonas sp.]MBP7115330.1 outer membrane protein assembly factor BamA [Polaromonas sp.]MBP8872822.1 outer membrane protein assembly factor BamA [Polaromonas sp.]